MPLSLILNFQPFLTNNKKHSVCPRTHYVFFNSMHSVFSTGFFTCYPIHLSLIHILPRLRRTHEETQSRPEKAETKAEMSRFRAFQTRINQGFFRGCQRVRDTFILFPRKRRSKCVQTPQIHPKEEPCQITENTTTSS